MVGPRGEFPVKPERTDIWRILIANAMRYKGGVCNGHKVFRGCAVGPAKAEGVFTNWSLGLKAEVLQDDCVSHKSLSFARTKTADGQLGSTCVRETFRNASDRYLTMMS